MTKTAKEWFDELPTEIRIKALINTTSGDLKERYGTLKQCLFHSFEWISTPEGGKFWSEFYQQIEKTAK